MVELSYPLGVICFTTIFSAIVVYRNINQRQSSAALKEKINLIVVILSARQNLEKRNNLRQTWLSYKQATGIAIKPFFVIGNQDCQVAVDYREDVYNCKAWYYNETEDLKTDIMGHAPFLPDENDDNDDWTKVFKGFSFKVHQDILVKKVGCLSSYGSVNLIIKNVFNQEIIVNKSFVENENDHQQDFTYQDVSPILFLPKGFIGVMIVDGVDESKGNSQAKFTWNHHTKLVQVLRVYNEQNDYASEPFTGKETFLPTFILEVADRPRFQRLLRDRGSKSEEVKVLSKSVEDRLQKEIKSHDDILLVNVVDVYRNLPRKLVNAMSWVDSRFDFDFILKTDDDCYLDLISVSKRLTKLSKVQSIWWGKKNLLVDLYGKWAEKDYPSPVYPAFSCGSGYVLSASIVHWIAQNRDMLHHFQGEDVSLGIWLASILPVYLNDKDWLCSEDPFRSGKLAYCQLNTSMITHIFEQHQSSKP